MSDHHTYRDIAKILREVELSAVTQNGLALQFAHPSLRNNCGVVMAAVTQNNNAFHYAGDGVKNLNHALRMFAGFYPYFRNAHMDGCHRENCDHCKSYYSK